MAPLWFRSLGAFGTSREFIVVIETLARLCQRIAVARHYERVAHRRCSHGAGITGCARALQETNTDWS